MGDARGWTKPNNFFGRVEAVGKGEEAVEAVCFFEDGCQQKAGAEPLLGEGKAKLWRTDPGRRLQEGETGPAVGGEGKREGERHSCADISISGEAR